MPSPYWAVEAVVQRKADVAALGPATAGPQEALAAHPIAVQQAPRPPSEVRRDLASLEREELLLRLALGSAAQHCLAPE